MTQRGAARRWLVGSLLALLAAWLLAPSVVPIYDGIGNPDEPYRYVQAPAGAKATKPPTAAKATVPVRGGQTAAAYANSGESGPQISLYLPAGAFGVPAGATAVVVTAEPLAPQPPEPRDGTIVSNVYRISATAAGGADVPIVGTGNQTPTLQMRAPDARSRPVFEHRTTAGWQRVDTLRVGNDIYQAQAPSFGEWALVRPAHSSSGDGGGGVNVGLLAGGIAVLVVAGAILAVRMSRSRGGA